MDGTLENSVKPSKFNNVSNLTLHFRSEYVNQLSIRYIQLKGVKTDIKKKKLGEMTYEIKPMMSDHKVDWTAKGSKKID